MIRSGRVNYCSWIIGVLLVGMVGLLSGCATPAPMATDADYAYVSRLMWLAQTCKQNAKLDDRTYASFITSMRYYTTGTQYSTEVGNQYMAAYSRNSFELENNCYEVYTFIEEQNNNRQRSNANAAAANTSQQQQWENVGTINKVPVCTKIGGSLYCN